MSSGQTKDILQGDLAEANLPEILQFIHSLKHDGQLLIEDAAGDGTAPITGGIYFHDQLIVHAALPPLRGVDAFRRILTLNRGRFLYIRDAKSSQRSIELDFNSLMLDGLRYQDEFHLVAAEMPPIDSILYPCYDRENLARYKFTYQQWSLYQLIDGRLRIQDIMYISPDDNVDIMRNLQLLMKSSLISDTVQHDFLEEIVLQRLPPEGREFFPSKRLDPLSGLILRHIDGDLSLDMILKNVGSSPHDLMRSVQDLLTYRWVTVVEGIQIAQRYLIC